MKDSSGKFSICERTISRVQVFEIAIQIVVNCMRLILIVRLFMNIDRSFVLLITVI